MVSDKSIKNVFRLIPTACLVLLPDYPEFTIIEANDAYLELTNVTREDIIGKGFYDIFRKNRYVVDTPEWRMSLEKVLAQKSTDKIPTQKFNIPIRGSSIIETKYLNIENIPFLDEKNEIELIIRSYTDVTDAIVTKKHEEQTYTSLVKHEKFLVETQRLARSGSWEFDFIEQKLIWSDIIKEIHEVEADYVPEFDTAINFYKSGKDREMIAQAVDLAIKTGKPFDLELTIITNKLNERVIRTSGAADIKDGKCIRLYGAFQDITDKKKIKDELVASRNQYKSLLQTVQGIVWEADASPFKLNFVSDHVKKILGFSAQQFLQDPAFWQRLLHPEDRETAINYFRSELKENGQLTYRMFNADNNIVWIQDTVSIIYENGYPKYLRGLMVDITTTKRLSEVERLEKELLELNSLHDISVEEALHSYLTGIEALFPQLKCSILQVRNNHLYTWLAPSLPKALIDSIEGIQIGENAGSCGSAAFLKQKVLVSDIKTDPRWASHKDICLSFNLNSCWSYPIIDTSGEVIASFGVYSNQALNPNDNESKILERAAAVIKAIMENNLNIEALKETTALMTQGQELAHFGNWTWDIQKNTVEWSDSLYLIYGLEKSQVKPTFELYLSLLHPDDKNKLYVNVQESIKAKNGTEVEERIIHSNGEVRYLKSWCKVKTDSQGVPVKIIGASLDITESKRIQAELLASEARFRSLVESQTNYVIRIDVEGKLIFANKKFIEDFGWLYEKENIQNFKFQDSVFPHHAVKITETIKNCIQFPNKTFKVELDKKQKGRGVRYTLWHFIGLADSAEDILEIQCVGIDVSDQKQAENNLRISNERYSYVNKATNDAIYDWDIEEDHITWGDGFYRSFGYRPDKSFNLSAWSDALYPSDRERVNQTLNDCLADLANNKWTESYQLRRADGSYAFVEENGYVIRTTDGKAVRMIGALRDITERKKAEEKLKILHQELETQLNVLALSNAELDASQKKYSDLFHLSPQPMWVYDLEGLNFLDVNDAAIRHYGYSREEFLSMTIIDIRPSEDIPQTIAWVKETSNDFVQKTSRHQKKNGELILVEIQRNVIRFSGKTAHLILAHDITERTRYTDAIQDQNRKLKEIAFMQSHIVRAPLARMMGLLHLIKEDKITNTEKIELFNYILTSANELDSIITDISGKAEQVKL